MSDNPNHCGVCGCAITDHGYLLVAPEAQNRIAILRWDNALATSHCARPACGPEHTLEIVAHWMVSGRFDLKFTDLDTVPARTDRNAAVPQANSKPISELVINRDSIRELVANDPEALASVLDSLLEAMDRDRRPAPRANLSDRSAPRQVAIA